jgi:hypothetical protein
MEVPATESVTGSDNVVVPEFPSAPDVSQIEIVTFLTRRSRPFIHVVAARPVPRVVRRDALAAEVDADVLGAELEDRISGSVQRP